MRLSIVTPVWNDPRVSRCIQSIHAQNCAGEIEVIVVDGGSTEPTQKALRSVSSQIDHLISEPDRGIYDAMNKGIRLASGDAIGILNADDQYDDSDFLTQVQRAFQESAQVTYSDIVVERMDGSVKRRWRAGRPSPLKWRLGWMPPHPGMFVHRDIYERFGLYDLGVGLSADYEFMIRVLYQERIPLTYVPVNAVRMAEGGQTHTTLSYVHRGWKDARRIWKAHGLTGGTLAATGKPIRKITQWRPSWVPGSKRSLNEFGSSVE